MSKFFNKLVSEELIDKWADILDWLFDDLKFSKERNWNGGYVSSFTKKLKKHSGFNDENRYKVLRKSELVFPSSASSRKKKPTPSVIMKQGESEGKDLIRHIRNGIAHGLTEVYKVQQELYIEIIDYSDKVHEPSKQTAFIRIPLSYISDYCQIYSDVNKSIMNTKEKDRKNTKKYKGKRGKDEASAP